MTLKSTYFTNLELIKERLTPANSFLRSHSNTRQLKGNKKAKEKSIQTNRFQTKRLEKKTTRHGLTFAPGDERLYCFMLCNQERFESIDNTDREPFLSAASLNSLFYYYGKEDGYKRRNTRYERTKRLSYSSPFLYVGL